MAWMAMWQLGQTYPSLPANSAPQDSRTKYGNGKERIPALLKRLERHALT